MAAETPSPEDRRRLLSREKRRVLIVREILNRYDPAGLITCGAPEDEYDPEMRGVLRAVRDSADADELGDRIARVFHGMFGGRETVSGPEGTGFKRWKELGAELWRISRTQQWH